MSSDPTPCCLKASPELKLYQAFIFSIPIFFTFILLLLFYLFYLRRRRVDWSSLRMRTSYQPSEAGARPSESGLKKEVREMLPVIIFKESFLVRDTQCSVCLGDYQANDHLQQIPACGHTFHMECIDHWLATNTTCPLCRLSLLPAPRTSSMPVPSPDSIQSQRDSHLSLEMNMDSGVGERESSGDSGVRERESAGDSGARESDSAGDLSERNEEGVAQQRHSVGRVSDGETCTGSNCQVEDSQVQTKDAEVEETGSGVEMHCHCALERV